MRSPKGRLELTWMGKDMALIPTAATCTKPTYDRIPETVV